MKINDSGEDTMQLHDVGIGPHNLSEDQRIRLIIESLHNICIRYTKYCKNKMWINHKSLSPTFSSPEKSCFGDSSEKSFFDMIGFKQLP